jgi:GNAT superfamily N-acetyltransferase
MTDRVQIRPADPEDAGVLLALIRALAEYERLLDEVVADEAGLRAALTGESPAVEALIAEADGQPVGFALYFRNFSTFLGRQGLYLEDLFVLPRWRGRGLGRRLMETLARQARAMGARRIDWAVLEWNEPAIGFYRGIGAAPLEDWRSWRLGEEALERLAAQGETGGPSPGGLG